VNREVANVHITNILVNGSARGGIPTSFDGEAFDSNCCKIGLLAVYDVIDNAFDYKYSWIVQNLFRIQTTTDLICPSGVATGRVDAVASGRGITNLADCLYQMLMSVYCCIKNNLEWLAEDFIFNGDDGIWSSFGMTLSMIIDTCKDFGMPVNKEKLYHKARSTLFCNRFYTLDYMSGEGICFDVRSAYRFITHATGMERPKANKFKAEHYSVRLISQFEEFKNHPIYFDLLKYCIKSDTLFGLGTTFSRDGLQGPVEFLSWAGRTINGIDCGGFETASTFGSANSWDLQRARRRDGDILSLKVVEDLMGLVSL
jgi:hypothetical protein